MSFPRYPAYKDSGVEWLGEVPAHWEVVPIKHLGRLKGGAGFPHEHQGSEGEELSFHKVNALAQAARDGVLLSSDNTISLETAKKLGAFIFPPRTIVFAKVGAALLLGRIRLLNHDACLDNNMMGLVVHSDAYCVDFVKNAMSLVRFDLIANPGAVPSLNEGQIGDFQLAIPPIPEQTQIAAFLDRETAKIDELVAEQRRLMELLKEKRQTVISHAVTQGLNPDAPMKPSGIEWLGDVPAHWEVIPLKHLCSLLKDGTHLPPERVGEGVPLLSVRNIVEGAFVLRDDDSMIADESYQELSRAFVPETNDVLLAIVGATLGKTAVIPDGLGLFHIQRSLAIFRTKAEFLNYGFLNLIFQSRPFQMLLWQLVGYSAQPGIYLGTLQNIRIPVPQPDEQLQILELISSAANDLTVLTTEAQRAIALLQERRSALISAAVTGQIDVRLH